MTNPRPILLSGLLVACCLQAAEPAAAWLAPCNVTWTTPSSDSLDSMPLSVRRGAGANVS